MQSIQQSSSATYLIDVAGGMTIDGSSIHGSEFCVVIIKLGADYVIT